MYCLFFTQICFNPSGSRVLTASSDKTARLWDPETGMEKQVLEGHSNEIFSCAFNYEGNTIITGRPIICDIVTVSVSREDNYNLMHVHRPIKYMQYACTCMIKIGCAIRDVVMDIFHL